MEKKKYTYSFIVPHHNRPDLLKRLINTIPQRQDIEIIIVDDNSINKPQGLRDDCKLISIDKIHTKGAGKARNMGIEAARGEWLLFPDSDDFYSESLIPLLDESINNKDCDLIYFDVYYNYDAELNIELSRNLKYSKALREYTENPNSRYWEKYVKHSIQTPWNFAVKSELVHKTGIRFEEVPKGNDFYFHHKIAMSSQSISVISQKLYFWIHTKDGITNEKKTTKEKIEYIQKRANNSTILRVEAEAWNTITPLHIDIAKRLFKHGLKYTFYYAQAKFAGNIPWGKIYRKQLYYLFLKQ